MEYPRHDGDGGDVKEWEGKKQRQETKSMNQ